MAIDKVWHKNQMNKFIDIRPVYKDYADMISELLSVAAKKHSPLSIIQTRPKTVASFAEKAVRKAHKYKDPTNQLTDLCGGRIIAHTQEEVEKICSFIRKNFIIDEANSLDVKTRLKDAEFGYRSVHYVVQIDVEKTKKLLSKTKDKDLFTKIESIGEKKAEIQVRTVLSHAWADICHDRLYKTMINIPKIWSREFARIAALLENADDAFLRSVNGVDQYELSYGAYMTKEEIENELDIMLAIRESVGDNTSTNHKIARLAINIENWNLGLEVTETYKDTDNYNLVHDYSIVQKNRENYKEAEKYLKIVIDNTKNNIEAYCDLGDVYLNNNNKNLEEALKYYEEAFKIQHSDPRALKNFLETKIYLNNDFNSISMLVPSIKSATEVCKDRIKAGVYLPMAYFDIAMFYLFLGKPYATIEALTKGVLLSNGVNIIDSSLQTLENFRKNINHIPYEIKLSIKWAIIYLKLAKYVKLKEINVDKTEKEKILNEISKFLSKDENKSVQLNNKKELLIITGGLDSFEENNIKNLKTIIPNAIEEYNGIIITGGQSKGIGEIVGNIKYQNDVDLIGYLPYFTPPEMVPNENMKIIRTLKTQDISLREVLQYWIDIISSRIEHNKIKVLGIVGERITSLEYKIAISLGANVSIVNKSFGTKSESLTDSVFTDSSEVKIIPMDTMTIRAFVLEEEDLMSSNLIKENDLEKLAILVHSNYVTERKNDESNPSLNDWKNLPEDLKNANRHQILYSVMILKKAGYLVKESANINFPEFTDKEIEIMAELEHGRWNMQKLLDGWKYGNKKNIEKKISPYLIPYEDLSENIKEYDREAVVNFPSVLSKIGLEVYKA